jgi:hypothetical protein
MKIPGRTHCYRDLPDLTDLPACRPDTDAANSRLPGRFLLCRRTAASRSTIVNAGLPAAGHPGKARGTGIGRLLPKGIRMVTPRTILPFFTQSFVHIVHSAGAPPATRRAAAAYATLTTQH